MKINFEYATNLQYKVKVLTFESGEAYVRLKEMLETVRREKDRVIATLKKGLEEAHRANIRMRQCWMQVLEDMEKEHKKGICAEQKKTAQMERRALAAESGQDQWKDKRRDQQASLYGTQTELEKEKEKNRKLTAQVNRDFENSSLPSSLQPVRKKKIVNSREYYETGKIIRKQKIVIRMEVRVIEYQTKEYRSRSTGARVHAPFPEGYVNEVNYDGTVTALAFLLGNECGVSQGKIRKLVSELTEGEVGLSDGMINSLCREFSAKSGQEKQEIVRRLMTSPVMNADFTNANGNGKSAQVLVLAFPLDLEWNHRMHDLIREMLHYRNSLGEEEGLDPGIVAGYEERYDTALNKAQEEYEYEPPALITGRAITCPCG